MKPSNAIIRKALPKDIPTVVSFQLKMAKETEGLSLDQPTVKAGVSAVLEDCSKGCYYVCEINGEIAASLLTTFEWSDWRNGTVLWIQSVYVRPEYRKQGIYKRMYRHLQEEVLNDQQLKGIRLYADKSNHAALVTYTRLGMNQDHYTTFEWMKPQ